MDCPKTKGIEAAVACLPDDALEGILSRLRAKPLLRFKCVSKAWCGLIADRLRCRKFPQNLVGFFIGGRGENFGDFIDLSGRPVPLVDPSFSFLTNSQEIEKIVLLGSCNGLVLFGHRRVSDNYDTLGYIVCNPTTEQWVTVPSSGWTPWEDSEDEENQDDVQAERLDTYLIFDPAVSPHFQLVQLLSLDLYDLEEVHTFSSVTGAWRQHEGIHGQAWKQWGSMAMAISVACAFNGMLHMSIHFHDSNLNMIVAVDGEGEPFKTMHWPDDSGRVVFFVGQSQGHLHCMSVHTGDLVQMTQLSIWVLEDYDAEKWVLIEGQCELLPAVWKNEMPLP
ncbi:hypothetical protein SEVIR_2G067100v4 [Setaria viridis]|uniref:F-box domain-containing protein n=1 Tax=Setaria viridis TaxID=4556 RepID=A0A4U6VSQ5_SETVI|nr:F-box protein At1g30790-like [Setaria viridis]TKW30879.1 hypothetical protein SEVIR_2G067100v2 [Setaria viridis]